MSKVTVEQLRKLHEEIHNGHATRENLQSYLENPNKFLERAVTHNLAPVGWEFVEDVPRSNFQIKDLELVPYLKKDENRVDGETMRKRAVNLQANLGFADGKFLLDHQVEIPVEFQDYYLLFAGTLLRRRVGGLFIAFLCWNNDHWCLDFRRLDDDWCAYNRLVRCKPDSASTDK